MSHRGRGAAGAGAGASLGRRRRSPSHGGARHPGPGAGDRRGAGVHRPPGGGQDHARRRGPRRGLQPGHGLPGLPRGQGRPCSRAVVDTEVSRFFSALAVRMGAATDLEDVLVAGMTEAATRVTEHAALGYLLAPRARAGPVPAGLRPHGRGARRDVRVHDAVPRALARPGRGQARGRVGGAHRRLVPAVPGRRRRPHRRRPTSDAWCACSSCPASGPACPRASSPWHPWPAPSRHAGRHDLCSPTHPRPPPRGKHHDGADARRRSTSSAATTSTTSRRSSRS